MVSVMAAVENLNEVIISFFSHLHLLRMCPLPGGDDVLIYPRVRCIGP